LSVLVRVGFEEFSRALVGVTRVDVVEVHWACVLAGRPECLGWRQQVSP
jgi:hypothetical protein